MSSIPIDLLRQQLAYKPRTGVLTWKRSGEPAGSINQEGYRVLKIVVDGRRVQITAHKAIFALMTGRYAVGEVDHKDTNRANNRWSNLRETSRLFNMANCRKRGKLPKGVLFVPGNGTKPYLARIRVGGKRLRLGTFDCKHKAHAAYMTKARELYGEFARAR